MLRSVRENIEYGNLEFVKMGNTHRQTIENGLRQSSLSCAGDLHWKNTRDFWHLSTNAFFDAALPFKLEASTILNYPPEDLPIFISSTQSPVASQA